MLIPSIDLAAGQVVQLEQGERLRWSSGDIDAWVERFRGFPIVQVIDLDAARGTGQNTAVIARIAAELPCQAGGGIRTIAAAESLIEAGARRVILGSCLFDDGDVQTARAAAFAAALGPARLVAAIDSRGGRVVIDGWKTTTDIRPADAIEALAPSVGTFLYTHVDTEGLLTGFDVALVEPLLKRSTRKLIVAGGIRGADEVDALDALGIDAVVGMAIYTGQWAETDWRARRANPS
jgi:phosphoribosylformimino-5-aminoimidazole carboxamide ribotide isomerase